MDIVTHTRSYVNTVKVHPVLADAILATRMDLSYRVWLCLRAHDPDGRGLWLWSDVERLIVSELGIMAWASLYRAARAGRGLFWEREGDVLSLRSLEKVCRSFEARPQRPAYVPMDALCGVASFRAACLAASFADERSLDRVVSLETLAGRVGRSERTVWGYLRRAGCMIEHNALKSVMPPQRPDAELAADGWYRARQPDGSVEMRKRLPNSYHSRFETAPLGMTRKVRIDRPVHNGGRGTVRFITARKRDAQKVGKAIRQMAEGDAVYALWLPPTPRDKAGGVVGSRLWEGHAVAAGVICAL